MRVVLDTNVLVSALWWEGNERGALLATQNPEVELLLSDDILAEFLAVVARKKFAEFPRSEISKLIEILLETAVLVEPHRRIDVINEDQDDNRILECAVEGKADFIVTGDRHLLKLGRYEGVRIVRAIDFLKACD